MAFASLTSSQRDGIADSRRTTGGTGRQECLPHGPSRWPAACLAIAALALPGCVTTESWVFKHAHAAPKVSRIDTKWMGLAVTNDTQNGGKALPCVLGRLYLSDAEVGTTMLSPGMVDVELYDLTNPKNGKPTECLERWQMDPKTLSRLAKKDIIGQGYTLLLPWGTYRPDISKVQMRVAYTPVGGSPIYGEPALVTIRQSAPIPIEERQSLATPKR